MARAGREAAYRELIRRYERPIFALLFRMVRDRELAEDLSQETFIKALNAIESYRPEFKFSSWIFKIANNSAIDHLRRRELDTLSLEESDGGTIVRTHSVYQSLEARNAMVENGMAEGMDAGFNKLDALLARLTTPAPVH